MSAPSIASQVAAVFGVAARRIATSLQFALTEFADSSEAMPIGKTGVCVKSKGPKQQLGVLLVHGRAAFAIGTVVPICAA